MQQQQEGSNSIYRHQYKNSQPTNYSGNSTSEQRNPALLLIHYATYMRVVNSMYVRSDNLAMVEDWLAINNQLASNPASNTKQQWQQYVSVQRYSPLLFVKFNNDKIKKKQSEDWRAVKWMCDLELNIENASHNLVGQFLCRGLVVPVYSHGFRASKPNLGDSSDDDSDDGNSGRIKQKGCMVVPLTRLIQSNATSSGNVCTIGMVWGCFFEMDVKLLVLAIMRSISFL